MVLTNAIYFNASWTYPFDEADTRQHPFRLLNDTAVDVPMMRTSEEFLYAAGDGCQAVDLPYVGYELSMTVIVPDRGRFREFEDSLDVALVDRIVEVLEFRSVTLDLPKFEFDSEFHLSETLKTMGMSDASTAPPPTSLAWTGGPVWRETPSASSSGRWCTRHSCRWTKRAPRRPRPPPS